MTASPARYFELADNVNIPSRWHLRSPVAADGKRIDPWQFEEGAPIEVKERPLLPVARSGTALDFTLTGLAIPVAHGRVVSLFYRIGLQSEVQFIPSLVEGCSEEYFILNVLKIVKCIDDARCLEVAFWEPRHGDARRIGEYRNVVGLKIDAMKVGGANVFRPWGWTGALIVSERVKLAMEEEGVTGAKFIEV